MYEAIHDGDNFVDDPHPAPFANDPPRAQFSSDLGEGRVCRNRRRRASTTSDPG